MSETPPDPVRILDSFRLWAESALESYPQARSLLLLVDWKDDAGTLPSGNYLIRHGEDKDRAIAGCARQLYNALGRHFQQMDQRQEFLIREYQKSGQTNELETTDHPRPSQTGV